MIVISHAFIIHVMLGMVVAMPGLTTMAKGFGFGVAAFQRTRMLVSSSRTSQNPSIVRHTARFRYSSSRSAIRRAATRRVYLTATSAEEEAGFLSSLSSPTADVRDFSSTSNEHPARFDDKKQLTRSMLSSLIQRSKRTLASKSSLLGGDDTSTTNLNQKKEEQSTTRRNENDDYSDDSLLFAVDHAVHDILDTAATAVAADDHENANNNKNQEQEEEEVRIGYNSNPTITSTALAHVLWSHVLQQPNVGVVDSHKNVISIDATAGNGADSVALARMLFLQDRSNYGDSSKKNKLICIDIQREACETTRKELTKILPRDVLENQVDIHQASHASLLPLLDKNSSNKKNVALVVYNLGFLPNSTSSLLTCTESTISSMADAVLSIRIGGLLSVMTYPRTNREEDWAVHVFLEGLALFSSKTDDWQEFVSTSYSSSFSMETHRQQESVRRLILETLTRVKKEGPTNQTWRVHEYKKLGWRDAPILLTASRIK
jgi:Putative rRNA methylase